MKKLIRNSIATIVATGSAIALTSVSALADGTGDTLLSSTDLATFGFDTSGLKVIALAALGVLASIMVYRKMVKSTNRS